MNKEILTLSETENEKRKSYFSKYLISINSVDIDKIIISNKVSFGKIGFKYSIGYGDKKNHKAFNCYIS